jgi:hypothetical protein
MNPVNVHILWYRQEKLPPAGVKNKVGYLFHFRPSAAPSTDTGVRYSQLVTYGVSSSLQVLSMYFRYSYSGGQFTYPSVRVATQYVTRCTYTTI